MATWTQGSLSVEGAPTMYEKIDSQIIVTTTGGASSVRVQWLALGLSDTTYYFDANSRIQIPLGDVGRAMVEAGLTGSQPVAVVTDDLAPMNTVTVMMNVYAGGSMPEYYVAQRRMVDHTFGVHYLFCLDPGMSYTADWSKSTDGGATWGAATTMTSDVFGIVDMHTATVAGEIFRIVKSGVEVWRGKVESLPCEEAAAAFIWVADNGASKFGYADIVSVGRKVTERVELDHHGATQWWAGAFVDERKNWTYQLSLVARDLAADEACYFDDLFTSNKVTMMSCSALPVVAAVQLIGNIEATCRVTNALKRKISAGRYDVAIEMEIMQLKSF